MTGELKKDARVKLVKDFALLEDSPPDLPKGSLGTVVDVFPADESKAFVAFDLLPKLHIQFFEPEFIAGSPEYALEILS